MIESLNTVQALVECTNEEQQAVADICQRATMQKGDRIFESQSPAEFLYFLTDGVVELRFKVTHYLETREIPIDRIRKGEVFGWSALAQSKAYRLSALAVEDGELLKAPAADIRELCSANHHFGYVLMKNIFAIIGERYDMTQQLLIDVIQKQLDDKERRM
jgi:CRP-like cAMP-binding protein